MVKLNIKRPMQVEAKTLHIHTKTRDTLEFGIKDQEGKEIFYQENDYTPGFFPGDHCGDYLILDIDIETGQILNWKPPTAEQLEQLINDEEG